jgi:hypothetical protein
MFKTPIKTSVKGPTSPSYAMLEENCLKTTNQCEDSSPNSSDTMSL